MDRKVWTYAKAGLSLCHFVFLCGGSNVFCFQYINCVADGRKVTGPFYSLVRNRSSMEPAYSSTYDLTKVSIRISYTQQIAHVCKTIQFEFGAKKLTIRERLVAKVAERFLWWLFVANLNLSCIMRKPTYCICENKDPDR